MFHGGACGLPRFGARRANLPFPGETIRRGNRVGNPNGRALRFGSVSRASLGPATTAWPAGARLPMGMSLRVLFGRGH